MKRNLVILMLTLTTFNVFAKGPSSHRVDPLIENNFKKEFGTATVASWQVVQDISIATYLENGVEKQVYYYSDGEVLGMGKSISTNLLPQSAVGSINQRFRSGIIQTVYEFKTKDAPTRYFVRVVTAKRSVIVAANEFGDIEIRKRERVK